MKFSKKHIILGIICLVSALLQSMGLGIISLIAMFIPYLAFCVCSFVICSNDKKIFGVVTILLIGLIALPVFDFISSTVSSLLMNTFIADVLVILVQTCIYFGVFILINRWISKQKLSFSPVLSILVIVCLVIYSVIEGLEILAFNNAINQFVEKGNLYNLLYAINGNNLFNILSQTLFYAALFGTSISFIREE